MVSHSCKILTLFTPKTLLSAVQMPPECPRVTVCFWGRKPKYCKRKIALNPSDSRISKATKYIDHTQQGIEVAPYFRPIFPKSGGYNVLILDVFDTETLREMGRQDPNINANGVAQIEAVDIVGDASNMGAMLAAKGLSGTMAYVVSSHNFEHLPNPIKFLRGCSEALKAGGIVSMIVPDCRACFDHFRSPTRLADWIHAYHNDHAQPSAETLLDYQANNAAYVLNGVPGVGCNIQTGTLNNFIAVGELRANYALYLQRIAGPTDYKDAHCTVMFPETLELLLRDCLHLGLIDLEIIEVTQTTGLEFTVHLRKTGTRAALSDAQYTPIRQELLRKINRSLGAAPFSGRNFLMLALRDPKLGLKILLRAGLGGGLYGKVQGFNRARLARRHNQD